MLAEAHNTTTATIRRRKNHALVQLAVEIYRKDEIKIGGGDGLMKVEEAKEKWCCNKEVDKCLADECMAWRWNDPEVKNEGYCGLAGKEGAE